MQSSMQTTIIENTENQQKPHYAWVDVVRGLGIVLVFYGHYIQRGIDSHNASAAEQFRFIYSFHMPLFFMMSGFFFRPTLKTFTRIRQLALRRIIPVIVFGLFLLPLWLEYEFTHDLPLWHNITNIAFDYLDGRPELNWVTWFLVCLFVCESMAVIVLSRLQVLASQILAAAFFMSLGLLFCDYSISPSDGWLYQVGRTWFLSEAFVALGFYILGYVAFPFLKTLTTHRRLSAIIFLITTTIVMYTYDLNHPKGIAVMMAARSHGDAFYFVLTAVAGSIAVFALAIFIQSNYLLQIIGRNSLALLGINGLFFTYIDPRMLNILTPSNNQFYVTMDSTLVTIVSLLFSAPIVYCLNRFTPQLIGNIYVSGPWLPALESR
jgi:fucose 4-O-acetylase-like acetyltransferase